MSGPRVFVCRQIAKQALDLIALHADMEVWPGELPPTLAVLSQQARTAEGILTLLTDRVDASLLSGAAKLKTVSNMAVGYDNIDVPEATRRGILVGITPGVLTETSADFAFALMMAAARRVVDADKWTRSGHWKTWGPLVLLGQDIHHSTLGIIGLGRIGAEIAKRAAGFDMRVLYYSRNRRHDLESTLGVEYSELPDLLASSDFVTVHVPLTSETRHFIGAKEFSMMKPTAVFVNTSRGPVVDQKALYVALRDRKIFAAGIDVTEVEPIPLNDPLLTLDNLVIAPHIASASVPTRTRMAMMAAENLLAGLRGEIPPHCVNPEALRR